MNLLQKLITEKVHEGKSYRDIGSACNITHVTISKYHKGKEPKGRELGKLATYFRTEGWKLVVDVEEFTIPVSDQRTRILDEKKLASLSCSELLLVSAYADGLISARKPQV